MSISIAKQRGQSGISGAIGGVRAMAPLVYANGIDYRDCVYAGLAAARVDEPSVVQHLQVAIWRCCFPLTEPLLILPAHLAGQSVKDQAAQPGSCLCRMCGGNAQRQVDNGLRRLTGCYARALLHYSGVIS
ncbi:MAG: hypothetical protein P0107_01980 [Nitrosomonas sp.]|nr:hypothetical protein [Nitrosomonas sp.]